MIDSGDGCGVVVGGGVVGGDGLSSDVVVVGSGVIVLEVLWYC